MKYLEASLFPVNETCYMFKYMAVGQGGHMTFPAKNRNQAIKQVKKWHPDLDESLLLIDELATEFFENHYKNHYKQGE